MRQHLWELNSILLVVLLTIILCSYFLLKKQIPTIKRLPTYQTTVLEETSPTEFDLSAIYLNDIFDTYTAPQVEDVTPTALIPTIPQPRFPKPQLRPQAKKIEMLPPLAITLHGILSSSQKENNVALIADETLTEQSYYIGDIIKDAQVLQILKDSVTLVRANGQYETFSLKREEAVTSERPIELDYLVKRSEDGSTISIDPENLKLKIHSISQVADELSLATAYQKGIPLGLQIGSIPADPLYSRFEIAVGDILTSLNSLSLAHEESRYETYKALKNLKYGDTISLNILRKGKPLTLSYHLVRMQLPATTIGVPPSPFNGTFNLSKQQQRAENVRKFAKEHQVDKESTVELMRQQLFEDIKNREPYMRSR